MHGHAGAAAQLLGPAGGRGGHLPRGSWEPALLRGTLLSPPQEALFVKLGRLAGGACMFSPGELLPLQCLFGLRNQGAGVCAKKRGLGPFSVHPARPPTFQHRREEAAGAPHAFGAWCPVTCFSERVGLQPGLDSSHMSQEGPLASV